MVARGKTLDPLARLSAEELEELAADPVVSEMLEIMSGFWFTFQPRPDRPEEFDQQESFCRSHDAVSFLIGGNAAGTTEAAAFKCAQFVLRDQEAPRRDTPFWIISETYGQSTETCWKEKLLGKGHIPESEIAWDRVSWLDRKLGLPLAVPLKPWPGGNPNCNWLLEFKSYKQGRRTLQARSIGGFWFSEQFPWNLFLETLRGCRDHMFPGAQFCEFTPIDPELCLQIEEVMHNPPDGWNFYRANTELNRANLAGDWYQNFFATVSEEMLEVRKTGALAGFEGTIFPSFLPAVHVIDEGKVMYPDGAIHYRGTDWGASEEHPHVTLWAYRDGIGDWVVYDEYFSGDQYRTTADHAREVRERWPWPENSYYRTNYADPSRPDKIHEFNLLGVPTLGGRNDVFGSIETVRTLLKPRPSTRRPRLLISSRCKKLIQQLRKYRWVRGKKPTEGSYLNPAVARPAPLKRDDDAVDALRYIVHSEAVGLGVTIDSLRANVGRDSGAAPRGGRAAEQIRRALGKK